MQLTRRRAAGLCSLAAFTCVALTAGCSHSDSTGGGGGGLMGSSGGDSAAVATLTTPKGTALTITQPEFYAQLQNYTPNTPPQTFAPVGQPAGRLVLQQLLLNLMVEGLAQDQGVAPTDAEVNTQYNNIKLIQDARSIKPFETTLTDAGLSPQSFQDLQVRPQLAQLKLMTKDATVTDTEIQSYYNVNKNKQFTKPARVHLKRIVVATLPEAQAIVKAIKGGQTFESQIGKSLDKNSPDGDVPQWVPLESTDPNMAALTKPIKDTPAGQVAPPITVPGPGGQNSYWVVKVVEKKEKDTPALDQVKDLIRANLLQQKASENPSAQQNLQQQLHDFQSKCKITVTSPQYQTLAADLTHPRPLAPPAPAGGAMPFTPGAKP